MQLVKSLGSLPKGPGFEPPRRPLHAFFLRRWRFEMRLNPFNLNLELILFSSAMQFSTAVSSWLNDNPNYGQFAFQILFAADALAIENRKYSFQDKCILEHLKLYFKYNFLDISYLCSICQTNGLLYHACC